MQVLCKYCRMSTCPGAYHLIQYCLLDIVGSCSVSGTFRSNLDPFDLHDDATLWDALKRSHLVSSEGATKGDSVATPAGGSDEGHERRSSGMQTPTNRFTLDSIIEEEGSNLSIGQVRGCFCSSGLGKNVFDFVRCWFSDHWFPSLVR
jgi:hypothetical protein